MKPSIDRREFVKQTTVISAGLAPTTDTSAKAMPDVQFLEGMYAAGVKGYFDLLGAHAAGFKAGVANGHHFINRTDRDAVFLVVGTRARQDRCHYPDIDLVHEQDGDRYRLTHKSGAPYGDWQRG